MGILTKTKVFLQESRREFKRVNWPTRQEAVRDTIIVIGISLAIAAFLGGLDYIFTGILQTVI